MTLAAFFEANPKAALGLSGGVDSAYLLYAARTFGADVRPYFVKTAFQPAFELEDARRLTDALDAELTVIDCDILAAPFVPENPPERCYYCKKTLFSALAARAAADGYSLLLDGTNASDEVSDRPGMRALYELQVRSPLRECGLRKDEIRRLSRQAGLFCWDKPAYACLATRVPSGDVITQALLCRIEQAECALSSLGFTDFRVRVYHDAARVQLRKNQMAEAIARREAILAALRPAFSQIFLDLDGRA